MTGKDFVNKFNEVKDYLGLESDAEVIRFLVNYFWKKFVKENGLLPSLTQGASTGSHWGGGWGVCREALPFRLGHSSP